MFVKCRMLLRQRCVNGGANSTSFCQQTHKRWGKASLFQAYSFVQFDNRDSQRRRTHRTIKKTDFFIFCVYNNQLLQIKSNQTQMRIRMLKFALSVCLLVSVTASDLAFCRNQYSLQQLKVERTLQNSIVDELSTVLETEPHLLSKILQYLINDKAPLENLKVKELQKSKQFRSGNLTLIACIIVFPLIYILLRCILRLGKIQISFAKYKKAIYRGVSALLILIGLLILVQSVRGISEVGKQGKSMNNILCQLLNEPTNFLRANNSLGDFHALERHIKEIMVKIKSHFDRVKQSFIKLKNAEQYLKTSRQIQSLINGSASHVEHELKMATKALANLHNYSVNYLQTMFAFQFVHHVYSFTYNTAFGTHFFIKFLLKHTEKLDKGIMISGVLGVLLFLAIGVIGSLIIAQNVSLIRGRKMMKQNEFTYLQGSIFTTASICLGIFVATSFAAPALFWLQNGLKYSLQNKSQFYQETQVLSLKTVEIIEIVGLLVPINQSITQSYGGAIYKKFADMRSSIQPYVEEKQTYFYDILKESLDQVKDAGRKEEIRKSIEQHRVRESFVSHMKPLNEALQYLFRSVEPGGDFDIVNTEAIGIYAQNMVQSLLLFTINRVYKYRQISGQLSVLLFLVFILAFSIRNNENGNWNSLKTTNGPEEIELKSTEHISE